MNPKPLSMAKDPWIAAALAALARAQRRAEEIARQTGTKLVLCKDGQLALVDPGPPEQDDVHDDDVHDDDVHDDVHELS